VHNDGITSVSGNVTYDTLVAINKMWCYFTLKTPQDENDKTYQKEFLKSVVDVDKALQGNQINPIVSMIASSFLKAGQQDMKFPLKKACFTFELFEDFNFNFVLQLLGHLQIHQFDILR
jgi:hypothetical protein